MKSIAINKAIEISILNRAAARLNEMQLNEPLKALGRSHYEKINLFSRATSISQARAIAEATYAKICSTLGYRMLCALVPSIWTPSQGLKGTKGLTPQLRSHPDISNIEELMIQKIYF